MKTLSTLHLVQFSFWDYETFNLRRGGTAFLGPNGAGCCLPRNLPAAPPRSFVA